MEEVREVNAEHDATFVRYLVAVGDEISKAKPICIVELEEWDSKLGHYVRRKKEWLAPFLGIIEALFVKTETPIVKG
jgi:hypothetical protein